VAAGSHDNIVFASGDVTIALLGVDDLIVVQTPDAILVARKEDAESIKNLMDRIPPSLH